MANISTLKGQFTEEVGCRISSKDMVGKSGPMARTIRVTIIKLRDMVRELFSGPMVLST